MFCALAVLDQSHWYICFSANAHRYHSNISYGDVRFGNFSHQSSNFSVPVLIQFVSNFKIVSQNYAL